MGIENLNQRAHITRQIMLLEEEIDQLLAAAAKARSQANYLYERSMREKADHKKMRVVELTVQREKLGRF